jgi:hypothetical protein
MYALGFVTVIPFWLTPALSNNSSNGSCESLSENEDMEDVKEMGKIFLL